MSTINELVSYQEIDIIHDIVIVSKHNNCETRFYFYKLILVEYDFFKSNLDLSTKNVNEIVLEYDAKILNIFLNIVYNDFRNYIWHDFININNCMELYELFDYLRLDFLKSKCIDIMKGVEFCERLYKIYSKYNIPNNIITKYLEINININCNYLDKDFLLNVSKHKMSLKLAYYKYIRYLNPNDLGDDWTKNIEYDNKSLFYIIINSNKCIQIKHDNMIKKCIEYLQTSEISKIIDDNDKNKRMKKAKEFIKLVKTKNI